MSSNGKANFINEKTFFDACWTDAEGTFKLKLLREDQQQSRERAHTLQMRLEKGGYSRLESLRLNDAIQLAKGAVDDSELRLEQEEIRIDKAKQLLWNALAPTKYGGKDLNSTNAKHAVIRCAQLLDPRACECVELLGKLFLRTPQFIIDFNIIDQTILEGYKPSECHTPSLPELDFGPARLDSEEMFQNIDKLTSAAISQEGNAVLKLMQLVLCDDLGGLEVTDHLYHMVTAGFHFGEGQDLHRMHLSGRSSAVTAWWPQGGDKSTSAYEELQGKICRFIDDNNLEEFLNRLDKRLADMAIADLTLHVTTELVAEVLMAIARRSINSFRNDEHMLYGLHEGRLEHWFDRRKAVLRLCQQAANGNVYAIRIIIDRVMSDDHWMIRQVAFREACQILTQFTEGVFHDHELHPTFQALVQKLVSTVYSVSDGTGFEDKVQTENVRAMVEEKLIYEMNDYPDWLKMYIISKLVEYEAVLPEYSIICKPILNRILEATGSEARQRSIREITEETSLRRRDQLKIHQKEMRKERRRQAELDAAENRRSSLK